MFLEYTGGKALVFVESPGMVFFNPDSGFETAFGYNVLIPDPDNPWYIPPETGYDPDDDLAGDPDDDFDDDLAYDPDDDPGDDDDGMDSTRLLCSSYINGRWMHYLAEHYVFPGLNFPGEEGEELMKENFDFMLRFWKRRYYHFRLPPDTHSNHQFNNQNQVGPELPFE